MVFRDFNQQYIFFLCYERMGMVMLREWAFQILKALAYLNQNGITHHNLAPHNILLDIEVKKKRF